MDRTFDHIPAPDPSLEHEADRLLALSAQERGRGEYPFHTAGYLVRCMRREELDYPSYDSEWTGRPEPDIPTLEDLTRRLRLTAREHKALRLVAGGHTRSDIGRQFGVSRGRASQIVRRAADKLRRSHARHAHEELAQMQSHHIEWCFRQDVNRFVYRPPVCCQEGYEGCRRTGLCDRRWYLFV